jgi:hypothetical protein
LPCPLVVEPDVLSLNEWHRAAPKASRHQAGGGGQIPGLSLPPSLMTPPSLPRLPRIRGSAPRTPPSGLPHLEMTTCVLRGRGKGCPCTPSLAGTTRFPAAFPRPQVRVRGVPDRRSKSLAVTVTRGQCSKEPAGQCVAGLTLLIWPESGQVNGLGLRGLRKGWRQAGQRAPSPVWPSRSSRAMSR